MAFTRPVEPIKSVVTTVFYPDRVTAAMRSRMPRAMTMIATEYANDVKKRMRDSPASGRTYARGRRSHRASAPGEPPAPDTGRLIQSVQWRVRFEGDRWFAEVGSTVRYALILEFGAARGVSGRGGKITSVQWVLYPRPAWQPALAALRPRIPGIMTRAGAA